MRRISEARKINEGYGQGRGATYIPFVKVGEFGSLGTSSNPIDWVTGRIVHLFSQGEAAAWHIIRWNDAVRDIREQYPLDLQITKEIAREYGIRHPNHGRTTMISNFLVELTDYSQVAVSVKASKGCLSDDRTVEKLFVEREYWRRKGVKFQLVFANELNRVYADNIRCVVAFFDDSRIVDDVSALKHLIAHKQIVLDMESKPLDYLRLLGEYGNEVEGWKQKNKTEN